MMRMAAVGRRALNSSRHPSSLLRPPAVCASFASHGTGAQRTLTPKEDYPIKPSAVPGVFNVCGMFLKAFGVYRGVQVRAGLLSESSKYCYVPPKYSAPADPHEGSEEWSQDLLGYKLGQRAVQVNRFLRHKHRGPVQPIVANLAALQQMGFVFNFLDYRFHLLVLSLQAYKSIHPDRALEAIPKNYIVGKYTDSVGKAQLVTDGTAVWPAETVGVYLGRLLHHFKHNRQYCSGRRQALRALHPSEFEQVLKRYDRRVTLGSSEGLNKDKDLLFADILLALRTYAFIHDTDVFSAPLKYEVHVHDKRFPGSIRGRNLGYICSNLAAAKSFQHQTYREEVEKIAPYFFVDSFAYTPPEGRYARIGECVRALRGILTARFVDIYALYRARQLRDPLIAQVDRDVGGVAVPAVFVVPFEEPSVDWPSDMQGYALGEVSARVHHVLGGASRLARLMQRLRARRLRRGAGGEVEELLLRLETMQYPLRDRRFARLYHALLVYKAQYGDINSIPHDFVCGRPSIAHWPADLHGYALGERIGKLRTGHLSCASSDAHNRSLLLREGVDLSPPSTPAEQEAAEARGLTVSKGSVSTFLEASRLYRQLQDVSFVQSNVAIAVDDERYPAHLRGYRLGRVQDFLQANLSSASAESSAASAALRQLLLEHDPCFFQDRQSERFNAYLQALRLYKQDEGSLLGVPVYALLDRADKRYPAYVRNNPRPFGRIVQALRLYTFQKDKWRDQIRLIEPSFYEDRGERASRAPEALQTGTGRL